MESKDILKKVSDALGRKASERDNERQQLEKERRELVTSVGKDIVDAISPILMETMQRSQITKDELKQALSEVTINVPEANVQMPEIRVPEARVKVDLPEIKLPQINVPQANIQYPDRMMVNIDGVDNLKPLPVMMMDTKGRPYQFPAGSSGGKSDFLTIKDIKTSAGASWFNDEGLRVSGSFSVTASNNSTHIIDASNNIVGSASNPMNVVFSASATTATNIVDSTGVAYSGSNPVPVVFGASATQAVMWVDSTGVAYEGSNPAPISGTVAVSGITNTLATNIIDSSGIAYSGSNPVPVSGSVTVSGAVSSTGAYLLNGDGTYRDSMPITGTITGITNTVAVLNIDSGGVGYSGSNPLPVTLVTGGITSIIAVGSVVGDAIDDGSAPVQSGGIARTANPTAVSGNDVVKSTHDDLGRQVMRPVQVRDLVTTAYATLTNGTETTLLAASAGSFHDLIYIMGSNNSDGAVTVDIRPVTSGNVVMTLGIPAYGTAGVSTPVPYPQSASDTGNNWTADMSDITGTTVYLSALFTREV